MTSSLVYRSIPFLKTQFHVKTRKWECLSSLANWAINKRNKYFAKFMILKLLESFWCSSAAGINQTVKDNELNLNLRRIEYGWVWYWIKFLWDAIFSCLQKSKCMFMLCFISYSYISNKYVLDWCTRKVTHRKV